VALFDKIISNRREICGGGGDKINLGGIDRASPLFANRQERACALFAI
jgi:hypothetical protein